MPRKVLTVLAPGPIDDGSVQLEVTLQVRKPRRENCGTRRDQPGSSGDRLRIPRVTRLMALAIKFQYLVDRCEVQDYADLARLGYVTRARLTQIMNLLLLAPDIQAEMLTWSAGTGELPRIAERHLRRLARIPAWGLQRQLWRELLNVPIT